MALAGDIVANLTANTKGWTSGMKEAGGSLSAFAGIAATAGGLIAGALGFGSLIESASNSQETMAKFDVVFGDNARAAEAWGDAFAAQMGRSEEQVARFLSSSQDLFVPIGFDPAAAEKLSQTVAGLAIDLASFNNLTDDQVFVDLQAAMTGSGETMKKYGVIVSEAAVKQELLNMGISKGTATEAEKVQARLNLIMRGTTAAQGDAIRSADGWANTSKRLGAVVDDLTARLGANLLPSITKVTSGFIDLVQQSEPAIMLLFGSIGHGLDIAADWAPLFLGAAAAIGTVIVVTKAFALAELAAANASRIRLAFSGPAGWAALAVGIGVAATSAYAMEQQTDQVTESFREVATITGTATDKFNEQTESVDRLIFSHGQFVKSLAETDQTASSVIDQHNKTIAAMVAQGATAEELGNMHASTNAALEKLGATANDFAAAHNATTAAMESQSAAIASGHKNAAAAAAAHGAAQDGLNKRMAEADKIQQNLVRMMMTPAEQAIEDARKLGEEWDKANKVGSQLGIRFEQLMDLQQKTLEDKSGFSSAFGSVTDELRVLRGEITETDLAFEKMAEFGVDDSQIEKLRAANAERDKLLAEQQAKEDAAKEKTDRVSNTQQTVRESFKTPLDEFLKKTQDVAEAISAGALTTAEGKSYLESERQKMLDQAAADMPQAPELRKAAITQAMDVRSSDANMQMTELLNRTGGSQTPDDKRLAMERKRLELEQQTLAAIQTVAANTSKPQLATRPWSAGGNGNG